MNKLAKRIYECIRDEYAGIAETGNIEYSLDLAPRQIANSLRPLIRDGIITCTKGGCTMVTNTEFGGSFYKIMIKR